MKKIIFILACFFPAVIYSQDANTPFDGHKWEAPYLLPMPKDWGFERFLVPISFAPQIQYKGVEDIRFTPGWANKQSDEYWSYAFLWYLDGNIRLNAKTIEENLKNYYTGLFKVNTDSAAWSAMKPVITSFKKIKTIGNDLETYSGSVEMTDYMTRTPITLNCVVHLRRCTEEKKTIIFHELSPRPTDHKVWVAMTKLWSEFNCKK